MKGPKLIHPTTNKPVTADYATVAKLSALIPYSKLDKDWQAMVNGYKKLGYPITITDDDETSSAYTDTCRSWVEKRMTASPDAYLDPKHNLSLSYLHRIRSLKLSVFRNNASLFYEKSGGQCYVVGTDMKEIANLITDIVIQYPPAGYGTLMSYIGADPSNKAMVWSVTHGVTSD